MRSVLLTNMYADLGGGELCLLAHARHLRARGIEVHVGLLEAGRLEGELRAVGASVFVLQYAWQDSRWRRVRLIASRVAAFAREIRSRGVDVVIAYTFDDFVLAGAAARLTGRPVVLRAQGELVRQGRPPAQTWLGRLLWPFMRFVRPTIVCTTAGEAQRLAQAALPARRITHVFLGADADAGGSEPAEPLPPASRAPVAAIFGRLVRWKGQDVFVKALALLARRGVEVEGWVVGGSSFGDGEAYETELRELAREGGIEDRVHLLGFRRDVAALMQRCDVVCHASQFEPFGMVIIEAMMAGKPVVASDVSGPKESVVDGETGRLVSPGSPEALADALAELLADASLRQRMGEAGRRRAREHFDLEKNLRALDAEIEGAMRVR